MSFNLRETCIEWNTCLLLQDTKTTLSVPSKKKKKKLGGWERGWGSEKKNKQKNPKKQKREKNTR